jgi:mRNA interferase RelE/StbE
MAYQVLYHPAVLKDDLPPISRNLQHRISCAIAQRLTTEPLHYGEPLRYQLKGLWKLRVGDYRVVYQVVSEEIWVFRIDHRKDVYEGLLPRLTWRP